MTRKGQNPIPMKIRLAIARLTQLHADTHPQRLAAASGVSSAYCRRLWRELDMEDWPDNRIALQTLAELKRHPQTYSEHEVEQQPRENALAIATALSIEQVRRISREPAVCQIGRDIVFDVPRRENL